MCDNHNIDTRTSSQRLYKENSFKGRGKLLTCLNSKGISKGVFELQGTAYSLNLALLELNYIFFLGFAG